ncbi:Uncharacterized protein dnm_064480 [Desulfonema magnum]|uniref:Uncharacterized protein n=1 Tax=Desulfonema magnum TaxID=45655 RepID=A0A975GQZ2_9BACT|nr:Uncharacterized protein dnm_064480 [Desulfonema magnum]
MNFLCLNNMYHFIKLMIMSIIQKFEEVSKCHRSDDAS